MTSNGGLPTLYHLRLSHFNEKARWALDHKRVPHVRESALPAWHVLRALPKSRKRTMPVLNLDGTIIGDSTEIIAALEEREPEDPLYPSESGERERALELEEEFDENLGADVRRVFLFHWLNEAPDTLLAEYVRPVDQGTARRYRAMFPLTKRIMRGAMDLRAEPTERSTENLRAALERIESELGERDYLVGDRFSVADLTGASLLAPILRPREYQYPFPEPNAPTLAALRDEISRRRAGAWALEIWSRHRGESAEVPA